MIVSGRPEMLLMFPLGVFQDFLFLFLYFLITNQGVELQRQQA